MEDKTNIQMIIIPMPKNLTFQILADGYLKAQTLLDELMQKPFVRKKHENVIVRLENLLVYEKEIEQAYYDVDTSTVRLYLKEVKYLDEDDEWFTTCEWCGGRLYTNFRCSECGRETETK